VVQFPTQADGMQIAEYLQQRAAGASSSPMVPQAPLATQTPPPQPAIPRSTMIGMPSMQGLAPQPQQRVANRVVSTTIDAAAAPVGVPSGVGTPRAQLAAMASQKIATDDVANARKDQDYRAALQQLQEMGRELARANADNATLKAKLAGLEAVQMDGATHTVELERRLQQAASHVTMLEAQRAKLNEELEEARAAAANMGSMEVMALTDGQDAELQSAQHQRDQAIAELAQMAAERQALHHELGALRQQAVHEIESYRQRMHAEVQGIEADRERLMNELARLGEALQQAEGERDTLRTDLAMREDATASATGSLQQAVDEITQLRNELDGRTQLAQQHEAEHQRLASELMALQAERDALQQQLAAAGGASGEIIASLEGQVRAQSIELDAARMAAANGQSEMLRLMSELSAQMEASELAEKQAASTIAHLGSERDRAVMALAEAEGRVVEAESRAATGGDAALALQAELAQAQEKLRQAQAVAEKAASSVREQVQSRTREVAGLVRALEPFAWGLNRALSFFQEAKLEGATEHIRSLQLLVKTLEKLSTDVNRVDVLADGIQVDLEA
jgi:chromosome segregation ATPase